MAVREGLLDVAEAECTLALDERGEDLLPKQMRSLRLYRLAQIKRQLGKFEESEALLEASLEHERTLNGSADAGMVQRQLEMSLVLAGQQRWSDGVPHLEEALSAAAMLDAGERQAMIHIVKRYARQLAQSGRAEQAARFAEAVQGLEAQ